MKYCMNKILLLIIAIQTLFIGIFINNNSNYILSNQYNIIESIQKNTPNVVGINIKQIRKRENTIWDPFFGSYFI